MFMWAPLRRRASWRKNEKQKLIKTPVAGPSPQQPSFLWDEDGLLLCLQFYNGTGPTASFLRFKIPNHTIDQFINLSKLDYFGGINRYVPHDHDIGCDCSRFSNYSLNPELNGPFPSDLTIFGSTAAIGSVVYGLDNGICNLPYHYPHIHYCDFSQWSPRWNMASLPYHRLSPVMVEVNKQLYLFENRGTFNDGDYTTDRGPLGFLFDPKDESCKVVPFHAFHSVGVKNLMVVAVGQKLLLLDNKKEVQYCYDVENSTWIPQDIKGLLDHISDFRMQPISVPAHNSIYWMDNKGRIKAFDWVNLKIFVGGVARFVYECRLRGAYRYTTMFLHLKDELFCLVWRDAYRLHLTFIHVCLKDSSDTSSEFPHRLDAFVVACSCYHIKDDSPPYSIYSAHLL